MPLQKYLGNRTFIYGLVAGVALVWAYHHLAGLPGAGGKMKRRGGKSKQQG